ncbi:MAG: RNA-binding S4 domain-containing protein [Aquihabitans sp.]
MNEPDDIGIRDEMIRLGQLLKLASLVEAGSDARIVLDEERVTVNGEIETRRGRQVRPGDVVALDGQVIRVIQE